jgi:hypothetical protein
MIIKCGDQAVKSNANHTIKVDECLFRIQALYCVYLSTMVFTGS